MVSDEITIIHQNRRVAAELSMFRKRSTSVIIDRAHHVNWKWFVQPTFNLLSRFVFHNKCSLYAILRYEVLPVFVQHLSSSYVFFKAATHLPPHARGGFNIYTRLEKDQ